jgi:hypothetical protein
MLNRSGSRHTRRLRCTLPLLAQGHVATRSVQLTHEGLILKLGAASQMEKDGHIVLVVGGIESCDIEKTSSHAISIVCRVQCRFPVVQEIYRVSIFVRRFNPLLIGGQRDLKRGKEAQQRQQEKQRPKKSHFARDLPRADDLVLSKDWRSGGLEDVAVASPCATFNPRVVRRLQRMLGGSHTGLEGDRVVNWSKDLERS